MIEILLFYSNNLKKQQHELIWNIKTRNKLSSTY